MSGGTKEHRRKHNIRRAGRRLLPELVEAQGGLCHWCKLEIVVRRLVPESAIVQEWTHKISWRLPCGQVITKRKASTDHLKMLANGGTGERENLAAACYTCNHHREQTVSTKSKEEREMCQCGRKKSRHVKRCDWCRMGWNALAILRVGATGD